MNVKLSASWLRVIGSEFDQPYMAQLRTFLQAEKAAGKVILPRGKDLFAALDATPFETVRVVILGQDPYHGPGQAHGLCFSVRPDVPIPPSLKNIYKELKTDLGIEPARHGCLTSWAEQGVLLLNSVLSVELGKAGSHQNKGWERFTDAIIQSLNQRPEPCVFLLWGAYAHKKAGFVDSDRHMVLRCAHPSPLSAHNGFLGCQHFSKANQALVSMGHSAIDWALPAINAPLIDAGPRP